MAVAREARCVLQISSIIGESPRWSETDQALYWVDINGLKLHRFDPKTGNNKTWELREKIGCFAFTRKGAPSAGRAGRIIAGMQSGIHLIDLETMASKRVWDFEPDNPDTRLNDGRCDAAGRFWAGSVKAGLNEAVNSIYRYEPSGRCTRMVDKLTVPNGLAFSPDNRTIYYTDSRQDHIFAWDYDLETGGMSNQRSFVDNDVQEGRPDGAVVDAEGGYWTAYVGAWRVARYTADGKIDRVVGVPVQRPTACTLGGPDFKTLYVTSATNPLSAPILAKQPLAGSLFAIDVDVPGLPEARFAG